MLLGTSGAGKKTLAHALLRHMGEDGPSTEDDDTGIVTAPKQAAIIFNQKCMLECVDVLPEEDEEDMSETGSLLPKGGAGARRMCSALCASWRENSAFRHPHTCSHIQGSGS